MGFFSKIRGTYESLFQIAKGGNQIKNNTTALEARNSVDSAFAIMRALDPVAANDLVTLGYFNANNAAALNVSVVQMPLALATKVSTSAIPDNSTIVGAILDVTTAYDAGALWNIRRTGDATKNPLVNGDSDPSTIGTYHNPNLVNWGSTGAGTVTATLTNAPTVGVAVLYLFYATPTDIS